MHESLIHNNQHIVIWSVLLAICLFGMYGERLGWFGKISGVLVTILAGALLTTFGILPSAVNPQIEVPSYNFIFEYFVPLAIPLLLFNVQIKKIIKQATGLLIPFLIGCVSVVVGALVAYALIDLGDDGYKVAGTFVGTYTGGSVNFIAVATALDFTNSKLFPSVITVDNVYTNVYFMLLLLLPSIPWVSKRFVKYEETKDIESSITDIEKSSGAGVMEKLATSLLIASAITGFSQIISPWLSILFKTEADLTILLITAIIMVLANLFPNFFEARAKFAFDIGMFFMYLFLAVIGVSCDIGELFVSLPKVLLFASVVLVIHLLLSLTFGKLLGISLKQILVASCACAAGPPVAAPMAASFGMKKAVSPAILVGVLGYAIGTFLGTGVGFLLK